jgi:hypothetical protein
MYLHSRRDDDNKTKLIAAIPMAGIIVAAGLLSGLSFINRYQPVLAQQDITGGNATTTTTTGDGGDAQSSSSACTPTQTGGGGATTGNNTTTARGAAGGNQSTTSEVRMHIEQACMALQVGGTQDALIQLNLALNALEGGGTQGNTTTATTATGGNATTGGEDGISVGGTSAADDYDETADDDA